MGRKRIAALLRRLLDGPATTGELARITEMSPRTIARDVKLLAAAGVPVYTQPGRGGGLVLAPAAADERCFVTQAVQRFSDEGSDEELLSTLIKHFRGTCGPEWSGAPELEILEALRRAVLSQCAVHLSYLGMNGRMRRCDVYPRRVFMRRGQWCLSAAPAGGGPQMLLVVARICACGPGTSSAARAHAERSECLSQRVEFLFPGAMALQLLKSFDESTIYETDTGDILIRPQTLHDIWQIGYYLSRRVPVQPVGPAELLDDAVKRALAVYGRSTPRYRCPARVR